MAEKKQTVEEFMATHPESEWPKYLVAAKNAAGRQNISVQEFLDRDRQTAREIVCDDE